MPLASLILQAQQSLQRAAKNPSTSPSERGSHRLGRQSHSCAGRPRPRRTLHHSFLRLGTEPDHQDVCHIPVSQVGSSS